MGAFGAMSRASSWYMPATPAASPPLKACSHCFSPASTFCLLIISSLPGIPVPRTVRRTPGPCWRVTVKAAGARAHRRPSVSEAVEGLRAPLPVLVHLDEQLQIGALRKLLADIGAHLFEDLAALADHDALLRLPLDKDLTADAGPLPLGDAAGDRVRQLLAGDGQQL